MHEYAHFPITHIRSANFSQDTCRYTGEHFRPVKQYRRDVIATENYTRSIFTRLLRFINPRGVDPFRRSIETIGRARRSRTFQGAF